jgi:molybdopterin synthase catalytic subunit/molybdopterin converting factor small subunit
MKIKVLAFATAREAIGASEIEIELADGSDLADLASRLKSEFPALEPIWTRLAVAVDGEMVSSPVTIREGSEVALLPPVSGGSPVGAKLVDGPIDVMAASSAVSDVGFGATVLFVGTVRNHHRGRGVERIIYDAYRPMAQSSLETIVSELQTTEPQVRIAIVHRLGEIGIGEASVVIATSSPHREAAYRASKQALERLKKEVPIWKQEHYTDGVSVWREEESLIELESIETQ